MTDEPKPRVVSIGNMKVREWLFLVMAAAVVGAGAELAYGPVVLVGTTVLLLAFGVGLWGFRSLALKKKAIDVLERLDED